MKNFFWTNRRVLVFILLFICGLVFRIVFEAAFPQPYVFDQEEYHRVALDILGEKFYMYYSAWRTAGYPLILAIIYKLFGDNTSVWKYLQMTLDTFVAVFIFFTSVELFKKKTLAWTTYILYLFNPFTSALTGVRLTDSVATFLAAFIFFILIYILKLKRTTWLYFLLAIVLAYLPLVRPGFIFFSLFIFIIAGMKIIKLAIPKAKKVIILTIFALIFGLPFTINGFRNLAYFSKFTPLTVDNLLIREFFVSLYIINQDTVFTFPDEVKWLYSAFTYTHNESERATVNKIMLSEARKVISADPGNFVISRIIKSWSVWEKYYLFPYRIVQNATLNNLVIWGNRILVMLGFSGLSYVLFITKDNFPRSVRQFLIISAIFILYISVLHAFTITAGRFTLPAYPLIILYASYIIYVFLNKKFPVRNTPEKIERDDNKIKNR